MFNGSTRALGARRQSSNLCILTKLSRCGRVWSLRSPWTGEIVGSNPITLTMWHLSSKVEHQVEALGVAGALPAGATKFWLSGGTVYTLVLETSARKGLRVQISP